MSDFALTLIVSIPGSIIALATFVYASRQFSKQDQTNGSVDSRMHALERELRFYKDKAQSEETLRRAEETLRRACEGERATAERQVRQLTAENLELRRASS